MGADQSKPGSPQAQSPNKPRSSTVSVMSVPVSPSPAVPSPSSLVPLYSTTTNTQNPPPSSSSSSFSSSSPHVSPSDSSDASSAATSTSGLLSSLTLHLDEIGSQTFEMKGVVENENLHKETKVEKDIAATPVTEHPLLTSGDEDDEALRKLIEKKVSEKEKEKAETQNEIREKDTQIQKINELLTSSRSQIENLAKQIQILEEASKTSRDEIDAKAKTIASLTAERDNYKEVALFLVEKLKGWVQVMSVNEACDPLCAALLEGKRTVKLLNSRSDETSQLIEAASAEISDCSALSQGQIESPQKANGQLVSSAEDENESSSDFEIASESSSDDESEKEEERLEEVEEKKRLEREEEERRLKDEEEKKLKEEEENKQKKLKEEEEKKKKEEEEKKKKEEEEKRKEEEAKREKEAGDKIEDKIEDEEKKKIDEQFHSNFEMLTRSRVQSKPGTATFKFDSEGGVARFKAPPMLSGKQKKPRDPIPSAASIWGIPATSEKDKEEKTSVEEKGVEKQAAASSESESSPSSPPSKIISSCSVSLDKNPAGLKKAKKKNTMEDCNFFQYPFASRDDVGVFCVFDGFAGDDTSKAVASSLPKVLDQLIGSIGLSDNLSEIFTKLFESLESSLITHEYVGSTCTVVIVWKYDGKVHIQSANVGDSNAVVCIDGHGVMLSEEHKVSNPKEIARVRAMGIQIGDESSRINGISVARALGISFLKEQRVGIVADPFISQVITLSDDISNAAVVVASDGLWDIVTVDRCASVMEKFEPAQAAQASKSLLQSAIADPKCLDNVTVVVAKIK
eukprot:TRINITY_DN1408_c0_g1_i1.p1 TRINITY_DN1408_c0_g1~~TRINITY_DN1408_c0_g1_i1.p1  ORF type:complete len:799 (-),score=317.13 TRINITY_DN1408_c0_g1_i1:48-2444(-)